MKNSIKILDQISILDWYVFFFVIALTIAAIIYGNFKKKKSNKKDDSFLDHMILGRTLTLPMFVATLVATWYGGIFGVTKIAFENGIYNFVTQGFFWYIAYVAFAFFLVDKIAPYKAISLPELIGKIFGPKSAKLSAIFNYFNIVPIAYTIGLGLFLQAIFGGNLYVMMIIGMSAVIAYSWIGGLRAVIFSDLIQFFVMCLGVFLVLVFSVKNFGGLSFLKESLPESYFSATGGHSLATTFVWGLIALSTLVDPNFYQRCFAAKEPKVAKRGIYISTCIWVLFDLCTTFGAMYAKSIIPEADSASAYLTYSIQLLPDGLRGFFLAGILATILSTLDSYIFLAGSTLAYDLGPKKFKKKISAQHISIFFTACLSIIMATVFEGNIKSVWKTLGSYSASCLLLPVLYGQIFPKKISDKTFCTACLTGVIFTTAWRYIELEGFWQNVDEIYIGMLATSIIIFIPKNIRTKVLN